MAVTMDWLSREKMTRHMALGDPADPGDHRCWTSSARLKCWRRPSSTPSTACRPMSRAAGSRSRPFSTSPMTWNRGVSFGVMQAEGLARWGLFGVIGRDRGWIYPVAVPRRTLADRPGAVHGRRRGRGKPGRPRPLRRSGRFHRLYRPLVRGSGLANGRSDSLGFSTWRTPRSALEPPHCCWISFWPGAKGQARTGSESATRRMRRSSVKRIAMLGLAACAAVGAGCSSMSGPDEFRVAAQGSADRPARIQSSPAVTRLGPPAGIAARGSGPRRRIRRRLRPGRQRWREALHQAGRWRCDRPRGPQPGRFRQRPDPAQEPQLRRHDPELGRRHAERAGARRRCRS